MAEQQNTQKQLETYEVTYSIVVDVARGEQPHCAAMEYLRGTNPANIEPTSVTKL